MGSARIGNLGGKYGNGRTHDPRCNCPDCNAMFAEHNASTHCTCEHCTQHREIFAPAPRVTRPEETAAQVAQLRQAEIARSMGAREWQPPKRGKGNAMGNLNICERPGCNAIIKGDAAGRVELEPNIGDGERKLYVLCPPCVSDVDSLLHAEPTEPRERAYDKAYAGYKAPQDTDDMKTATTEQLAAELFERLMRDAGNKTKALESGDAA